MPSLSFLSAGIIGQIKTCSSFSFYICSISQCPSDSDTEITKRSFITWRELESWYVQEAYIQALHISCATRWTDDCSEEQSFDLRL